MRLEGIDAYDKGNALGGVRTPDLQQRFQTDLSRRKIRNTCPVGTGFDSQPGHLPT
jgi:hypothetical protein